MPEETIYYVFEKATGKFAGSGVTAIDDETYGSVATAPPDPPKEPELRYDMATETWAWWVPVS